MEVVLDSNEFIFGFTKSEKVYADLLKLIGIKFNVTLPDVIFREVFDKLKILEGKDFASAARYAILKMDIKIVDEKLVPHELIQKYCNIIKKRPDAAIAAFTEWIDAKYIVSENRHFLDTLKRKPFEVLKAEDFMGIVKGTNY
ncbi:MAG: type II toxin-antitoxin system VapC family toxin [Nanoarchaeota archaeon]